MARDCGSYTHEDYKRAKKQDDEFNQKLKEYRDALKQMRDAVSDTKNIWANIWKL